MQSADVRLIVEQARNAWIEGNAQAFAELFAPEGKLVVPGRCWVGREAIVHAFLEHSAAYTLVRIEIRQILVDGEHAAVEWTWQDTEKATGVRTQAEDAILVDFEDGLVSRWREYIDAESPKAQV